MPDLEPRLVRLLGFVALALLFEQYDLSMLTSAIKFIAEDLGMGEGELGGHLGTIRLGALPALLVIPFADHVGRRRVFLAAVVGTSVGTLATAFAQTPAQFVLTQMATRVFLVAGVSVAYVIVTEELPAEHRGWGIGVLGALGAVGHGVGALLFAMIEVLPYGWRALYVVGGVPLFFLPAFRRGVSETDRFARYHASRVGEALVAGWLDPLRRLVGTFPLRTLGIAVAGGLVAIGDVPVFQFSGYFVLTVHGWHPALYSAMVIVAGGIGVVGSVVAGRLGDRFGRRGVGVVFLGAFPLFAWLFYRGPEWAIPIAWTMFVFCGASGVVVLRALSTELFPTSYRGTSAGWLSFVQTLGWALGLWLVGIATAGVGDISRIVPWLSLAVLLGALSLLLLPETTRRELEAISGER